MALGQAFVDVHANTAGFGPELERQLRAILRALPKQTVKIQADVSALTGSVAAVRRAAANTVLPFRAAALDISQAMNAAAAAGVAATERIAAAATTSAATLARQYGLAAGVIPPAFISAGRQVGLALSAASASGEKSIIKLAQVAQRTADQMQGSLGRAAQAAANEIQGSLRRATDAIVKDLIQLRDTGRLNFADMATAGRLSAERIAAAYRGNSAITAQVVTAAAHRIEEALEQAARRGITSFEGLSAVAAATAKQIDREFRYATSRVNADVAAMKRKIEEDFARITQAGQASSRSLAESFSRAARSMSRSMNAASISIISDLERIAARSALIFAGITAGAGAVGIGIGAIGTAMFVQLEQLETGLTGIFAGLELDRAAKAAGLKSGQDFSDAAEVEIVKRGQEVGKAFFKQLQQFAQFCVDVETEALTRTGWKTYDRLTTEDHLLSVSLSTGLSEWRRIESIYVSKSEPQAMIRMTNRYHDSLTTPNHKWPVRPDLRYKTINKARPEILLRDTRDLRKGDDLFGAAVRSDVPAEPKFSDAFVELVAWFWTEGTVTTEGILKIAQSRRANSEKCDRIEAALRALTGDPRKGDTSTWWGVGPCRQGGMQYRLPRALGDAVREVAPGSDTTRKLPTMDFLLALTPAQLELFINISIQGDGHVGKHGQTILTQKRRDQAERFADAVTLSGRNCRVYKSAQPGENRWVVSVHASNNMIGMTTMKVEEVQYNGVVWCPHMEGDGDNSTFTARRNGNRYITGNSPFELPEIGSAAQKFTAALRLDGQQTINVLTDVGNAVATVSGGKEGSERLERIAIAIGQISSFGKLTADNLNQISNALPTFQRKDLYINIAENLSELTKQQVSVAEATELATTGQINSQVALEAILETMREIPGAGKQLVSFADGTTRSLDAMERQALTLGAQLSQFKDAVRISFFNSFAEIANVVDTALDTLQPVFLEFLNALTVDAVGPLIAQLSPLLNEFLPTLGAALVPLIGLFGDLLEALAPAGNAIVATIGQIAEVVGPSLVLIAEAFSGALVDALPQLIPAFEALAVALANAAPAVAELVTALVPLIPIIVEVLIGALNVLAPLIKALAPAFIEVTEVILDILQIPGVAEFFAAIALSLAAIIAIAGPILSFLGTLGPAIAGITAVMGALATATGAAVVSFLAAAAPIAAIVAGLALLAIGVTIAYKKFETFRDVVDTIALGLVGVFQFLVNRILDQFDLIVSGAAKAFGWIPALGDALQEANRQFDAFKEGVNDALDGIQRDLEVRIRADASQLINETEAARRALEALTGKPFIGPIIPGSDPAGDFLKRQRRLARIDLSVGRPQATGGRRIPGSTDTSNPKGDGAAARAKEAARKAAETFREKIRQILDGLDVDFRETLRDGTRKAVDNALDALAKSIKVAFKGRKTKVDDSLVAFIDKQNKALLKLIVGPNGRDAILAKLEKATKRALEVASATREFASIANVKFDEAAKKTAAAVDEMAKTVTKLNTTVLDVAGSFLVTSRTIETSTDKAAEATDKATEKIKRTGISFAKALKDRLAAIKAFREDIEVLIKRGLDKNIIDQIVGAGVESGGETADALASASTSVLKTINKTQKEIDKQAAALGNRAADSLFRAGKSAVEGLIVGLKERKSEIAAAMGEITKELINRIRKDLKIKSPSRVTRGLFNSVGDGVVLGLEDSVRGVGKAAAKIAKASIPTLSPVSLPRLQAAAAAEGSMSLHGAMLGSGVSAADIDRVVAAVASARSNKEVHATVHQTFTQPVTPSVAKLAFSTVARR